MATVSCQNLSRYNRKKAAPMPVIAATLIWV
jgi:hypothetical protein